MTAAVILAAGDATRFGRQKLREPFRGRPLISWTIDTVTEVFGTDVFVVTGSDTLDDILPPTVTAVHNDRWSQGMATSLACGIEAAAASGHDAVVIGLGDQPLIDATSWRSVAASTAPVAVADFDGHRCPPVRLDSSVWPLLPTEGDEGARRLMASRPDLVVGVPCSGQSIDIDTQEDLARWS